MLRWAVCRGGYPNGWEPAFLETNDPEVAIAAYEIAGENLPRMTTVAIFDQDKGEGEPLDPEVMLDRLMGEI